MAAEFRLDLPLDDESYYNDTEDSEEGPSGERFPPLGAPAADEELSSSSDPSFM